MSTPDLELAARTRDVLDAAAGHVFGTEPGRLAAELYDVLVRTTDDSDRARVAAALSRCWVYGGHAARAAPFADEAVDRAERTGDPELIADCLDAKLAAHWGPDELELRSTLASRIEEVAAHVLDPEARLRATLWGLQVACEALHVQAIHRHLRALDRLGEESARAAFFAASRRWMYDALRGRADDGLITAAASAAEQAELPDAWMVVQAMRGYTALFTGDGDGCADAAEQMEAFARTEGVLVVAAEAAYMWSGAGRADRVTALLGELGGSVLDGLPQDVNVLLTLQCVLEAALSVEDRDVVAAAARALTPYERRAVFNAGATVFHGVTDDTLARAASLLGDAAEAGRLRERALSTYQRIGAAWWHDRLRGWQPPSAPPATASRTFRLHPTAGGLWLVGAGEGRPVPALRGLAHLHRMVSRPGAAIDAVDLVTDSRGTVLQPVADTVIDRRAASAYRRRLAEIDEELAEAHDWADLARVETLTAERGALLDELSAASGLGGRTRGTGSSRERARVAATKAVGTALDRISAVDPELGRHLRASVHTGSECAYRPAENDLVEWVLSEPTAEGAHHEQ